MRILLPKCGLYNFFFCRMKRKKQCSEYNKYASTAQVHIETYNPKYKNDFIRLNREWIEWYFKIEASDVETFSHVDDQ